ncbi:MAG TPA: PEP/pyruvate-binding domain-containing protein, partial [Spirochaetales bacterium]|nr:PEP/pyruvate-binding domain-containing protein [Spirochaetales bacterium]
RVSCAYTHEAALQMYNAAPYDMVVIMAGLDFDGPLQTARAMKASKPDIPVLLLAMNNTSLSGLGSDCPSTLSGIDRIFVWNGYSKLFVGMIKYVEDKYNVDNDTRVGMVRVILLIEDSVRYYSRYLPLLYSVVMRQIQQLVEEERTVETYKILRMRGRPKVVLATTYEEAMQLYEQYEPYLLTVISDVRFPRNGEQDPEAGFRFLQMTKERSPDLPVLIQSSEQSNRDTAYALKASFADKNSNTLGKELGQFFQSQLGFGPFVFRDTSGQILATARNMDEFEAHIKTVPLESLSYHADRNHFSVWLMARGEMRFARIIRNYHADDFASPDHMRDFICRLVDDLKRGKSRGAIPGMGSISRSHSLVRLGSGSIGGKGRGLAFIRSLIDNLAFPPGDTGIEIRLPFTAFIGIDEFERFMDQHELWEPAWKENDPNTIRRLFLSKALDMELLARLKAFLELSHKPLAVRSSGLFEDMLMVPFSGVYDTYLIPNSGDDTDKRLSVLCDAIRLVWSSMFTPSARSYFNAASYKIEEERMAVVVQELVGRQNGKHYYPLIAGTAQSFNYYPVSYLKPEDGLCVAALGLGPYVVGGGESWRFSPRYPRMDVVAPSHGFAGTQRWFYALNMDRHDVDLSSGEEATLDRLELSAAESNPFFRLLASTWNAADDRLEPGTGATGPRVIDFAPILKHGGFPLAEVVDTALDVCSKSMGIPVEIEYAVSMDGPQDEPVFYILQIKPLIQNADKVSVDADAIDRSACAVLSDHCMGNGVIRDLCDVVFVRPQLWDADHTQEMAAEIAAMNESLKAEGRRYVLLGP